MGHFGLSMVVLIGAVALAWRSAHEPGWRLPTTDALSVWSVRALLPLGALTIFAGTAATAAGPHSGGVSGQHVHRLTFEGRDTLTWIVHRHATIAALFGIAVIGVWLLHRRREVQRTLEPLTVVGVLLAAQGLVGSVQYELRLSGRHGLGARRSGHRHLDRSALDDRRRGQSPAQASAGASTRSCISARSGRRAGARLSLSYANRAYEHGSRRTRRIAQGRPVT